ncbi:hypothetical protein E4U41_004011 [Claviceps citrina]|nr:hypothetical protein E4U41_004011 [Claviceps citrina]
MRPSPLFCDGLWSCLCPAFDPLALRQAGRLAGRPGVAVINNSSRRLARHVARRGTVHAAGRRMMTTLTTHPTHARPETSGFPTRERLLAPTPPTDETLRRASLDDIVAALLTMRQRDGWNCHGKEIDRHSRILLLVRHLLSERGRPPSLFVYECVMDAMIDPQGSVKGMRKLLEDMASQNLKPTAELCQSALAALAVHPDYVLRQEILDTMHQYWFPIDTRAKQSVVLGLLRDEQYELAYLRLTEMMDQKAVIDLWVYDIFIMVFGKLGFIDEMLLLLYRRKSLVSEDRDMAGLLYYALDVCSQAFHYPGTVFAWNCLVRTSLVQPSDGVVENVLATAARHGDTALATEALDKIVQRTRLLAYHYEAVAEAFAADGDMAGAFHTLCVMHKNGIHVSRGITRAVHEALGRHPTLVPYAEQSLRSLASSGQQLPLAAVAVVIEALADKQGTEAAMALYRHVPRLCGEPATAAMIQTLLIHSRDAETTRALARDYTAHVAEGDDAVRSPHVYKALIVACAEAGELDLAFRFAIQFVKGARAAGRPRADEDMAWVRVLLGKAVEMEDTRIWAVVDGLGQDEDIGRELARMLRQARIHRRAADFGGR